MSRFIVVGTVVQALEIEESALGRKLPPSFRKWLLENNGLDLEGVRIYPVRDERDTRKTWESLSYNMQNDWAECLRASAKLGVDASHLLPFADRGTHDYYCFDDSREAEDGELPVVCWLHETAAIQYCARDFTEFRSKVLSGELGAD